MFKKFLLVISSGLLKLTLFTLAIIGAVLFVFGTPEGAKKALNDSGLYDNAVDSVLEATAKEAKKESGDVLPLDDPAIQSAVKDAVPPELLKDSSEVIIASLYDWLNGKTEKPEFAIDLNETKTKLVDGIAGAAQSRYEGLPVCTLEQLQSVGTDVDPFNAPCQVPGLASSSIAERVRQELLTNNEFLKDTVITADNLPKDEQGNGIADNFSAVPGIFGLIKSLPLLLGFVSLLLAVAVMFLSESKRIGLRRIGITLVGTGIFLLIGSLIGILLFDQANKPGKLVQEGNEYNANIIKGLQSLFDGLNQGLMRYYIAYIILGTGILLTLWYQGRGAKVTHDEAPKPPEPLDDQVSDTKPTEEAPKETKE